MSAILSGVDLVHCIEAGLLNLIALTMIIGILVFAKQHQRMERILRDMEDRLNSW